MQRKRAPRERGGEQRDKDTSGVWELFKYLYIFGVIISDFRSGFMRILCFISELNDTPNMWEY